MTAALALPAASFALGAAGKLIGGLTDALDPAKAKVKKQADDFESMFLEQVTDRLFATTEDEGPMGENGTGGGIFRSMMTQQYAKQIQRSGGIGLSDQIMRGLLQVQEQSGAPAAQGAANVSR
ncbi:flagellar biosynthesis protein FlgJ [Bosea caraganae]|uniref:Flagellar biosynthesis protein FlgJ n=1 Tax=Bosea caraganae TaxID=2763117 RepID=A0A370LB86_9HYPH|nr:rod-binding protein [Bosea caraganae]RDJ27225.1 flagellar biosynthesis protein FlgJ [Bosea caraganae]RDJ29242.1 flagellar biosynthesis protein FlgJ [Bosea caraganae]